jgi:hypothetical protein
LPEEKLASKVRQPHNAQQFEGNNGMKKILFLTIAISAVLIGCSKQEDMSSPPANSTTTTTTTTNSTTTNTNK